MIESWHLVQKGDTVAFSEIYDKYWETIYHTIYWRVCDEDIAKDMLQDVFIKLWEKRASIQITDTVEGYLRVMARNRVLSYFKAEATRKAHTTSANYHLPVANEDVSDQLAAKEIYGQYERAVAALPEKMRGVYLLSREKGYNIEQIALELSLSPQTVKNQLTAATKKIKVALEPFLQNKDATVRRFTSLLLLFT